MLKQTLALTGLLLSLSASAAIISVDSSFGVDTITRDTGTGLDWLDVTETQWLSYNQVIAQMGAGGAYEGWRYATTAELDQLITNFGYVSLMAGPCPYGNKYCDRGEGLYDDNLIVEQMIHMLGDMVSEYEPAGSIGYSYGILADTPYSNDYQYEYVGLGIIGDYERRSSDLADQIDTTHGYMTYDRAEGHIGSFLVQTTTVPIPTAAWLFGSALIGLAGIKRKG